MSVITSMLIGAVLGACCALLLYILGFGLELLNCAWQIVTCNCEGGDAIPSMWTNESFWHILIFCTIAGAILGFVYGIYKIKANADEESARIEVNNFEVAQKQRIKWADELKQKAHGVKNTCEENKLYDKPFVSCTYKSSEQLELIVNELTNTIELESQVNSIADELMRGGVNK